MVASTCSPRTRYREAEGSLESRFSRPAASAMMKSCLKKNPKTTQIHPQEYKGRGRTNLTAIENILKNYPWYLSLIISTFPPLQLSPSLRKVPVMVYV